MIGEGDDSRSRLLVLGASPLQLPALLRGRELGYRVAAVDRDPSAPGVSVVDDFFEISTTDIDAIVRLARSYHPTGVLTIGTDMPMRAVARVCQELELPGPSPSAIHAATDKGAMAMVFQHHDVPAPRFLIADSFPALFRRTSSWDLPLILKPVDSSGSRGVILVDHGDDFAHAFAYSQSSARSGRVIAQEVLRGKEVSVEGFCVGDDVHIVAVTDKQTSGAPYFVELAHSQPTSLSGAEKHQVQVVAERAARALGLSDCAIHVEIMVTATGPRVIELGARLGGDYITSHLVPLASGVDMVGSMIQIACGVSPSLQPTRSAASAIRFLGMGGHGPLDPSRLADAERENGIVEVQMLPARVSDGEVHSSTERAGHVIATCGSGSAVEALAACSRAIAVLSGQDPQAGTLAATCSGSDTDRLLVLGAGRGQVGLIKAAKKMGISTYVATLPSDSAPGIPLADVVIDLDIRDVDGIERAARRYGITGVATSCADTGLPALGRVSDALGLPGLTEHAAMLCTDKELMKEAFLRAGVATPASRRVSSRDDLDLAVAEMGLPVIVKAVDLQGSEGIAIARREQDLERAFEHAMEATRRDFVLVEQFIEGDEFGAQALVYNGAIRFVLPHNDDVFMAKTAIPILHSVPLFKGEAIKAAAIEETIKAVNAIGLDNCAVNIDLIVRGDRVFVIEVTGRVGANGLPELVSRHLGIDYYESLVLLALGRDPLIPDKDDPRRRPSTVVKMFFADKTLGRLKFVSIDHSLVPEAEYTVFRRPGDMLRGFKSSADCIGQILVTADSLDLACARMVSAERAITLDMEVPS